MEKKSTLGIYDRPVKSVETNTKTSLNDFEMMVLFFLIVFKELYLVMRYFIEVMRFFQFYTIKIKLY